MVNVGEGALYWAWPYIEPPLPQKKEVIRMGYTHTTTLDWSNALPNTIKTIKEWINITKWTIPVKVAFANCVSIDNEIPNIV